MRVGWVIVLLIAVLAISVWYLQRDSSRTEASPQTGSLSTENARKPASRPPGVPRDAARERPERERTDRPGN